MKKAVRNIQLILNKNGYDAGSADGVMGAKTKAAIAAFQKDNGMEATGEVDEKLVRKLLAKQVDRRSAGRPHAAGRINPFPKCLINCFPLGGKV